MSFDACLLDGCVEGCSDVAVATRFAPTEETALVLMLLWLSLVEEASMSLLSLVEKTGRTTTTTLQQ